MLENEKQSPGGPGPTTGKQTEERETGHEGSFLGKGVENTEALMCHYTAQ